MDRLLVVGASVLATLFFLAATIVIPAWKETESLRRLVRQPAPPVFHKYQKFALRRVSRRNVLPFVVLFALCAAALAVYTFVGRPFLVFIRDALSLLDLVPLPKPSLAHVHRQPGFTAPWRAVVFDPKLRKAAPPSVKLANSISVYRRWQTDGYAENGARHRRGDIQRTWEAMAEAHLVSYNIVNNPEYREIMHLLDANGYKPADGEEKLSRPDCGEQSPLKKRREESLKRLESANFKDAAVKDAAKERLDAAEEEEAPEDHDDGAAAGGGAASNRTARPPVVVVNKIR